MCVVKSVAQGCAAFRVRQPPSGTCGGTTAAARWARNGRRPIYTCVRMLEKHPDHCHFVPLFEARDRSIKAEHAICKSNRHRGIRVDLRVFRRFKNLVAVVTPKLPRKTAGVVHYV
jgi:hypothetical protein